MTTKNAYIEMMKMQLDQLNANMNKIEVKTKEAKEDARATYLEEMRKLRHQSKLAVAKFDEIKLASEDGWEKMAIEMDKVRDAFTQ